MKENSYLHIGGSVIIDKKDIIGIFDVDKITVFKVNREYLSEMEKKGRVFSVVEELPKSCILCFKKGAENEKIYLSPLLASTLSKRILTNSLE